MKALEAGTKRGRWAGVGLLGVLIGCAPERYTEAFYPEGEIREVLILGDAGEVLVESGERLRVERTIRGAERALSLSHSIEDGALIIESRCQGLLPCGVDVRLQMAEDLPVFVVLETGEVMIRDTARVDVELSRGDVYLEETGDLRIRLGQGSVQGRVLDGSHIEVLVAEGDVDLEIPGGAWKAKIEADSQQIAGLHEREDADQEITIVAYGGQVDLQSSSGLAQR